MNRGASALAADLDKPGKTEARTRKKVVGEHDRKSGSEIGKALRSIYDDAVREDIPPELLDLLGKLR